MENKKSSSGCFSFGCGCLSGILFVFLMLGGLTTYGAYRAEKFLEAQLATLYTSKFRPYIMNNLPLPEVEKKRFVQDMDIFVKEYPQMSFGEKKDALLQLMESMGVTPPDLLKTEENINSTSH